MGFEIFMFVVILLNSVVVLLSFFDTKPDRQAIYDAIDYWFVLIYILEFVLKMIGLGIFAYFRDNWNKMDFSLIIISLSTDFAFAMIKVVRNAKTAKASRIVKTAKIRKNFRLLRTIKSLKVD